MYTDTHCHFYENSTHDKNLILSRAKSAGVSLLIDIGYNTVSSKVACEFSKNDGVYFMAGIHPDSATEIDENLSVIESLLFDKKCVAVGEIGLDYHYPGGLDKLVQQRAFIEQIKLANKHSLPISIHSRDATFDMVNTLVSNKNYLTNSGVMHCYSGSIETAKIFLDLGLYISFSGVLTFKNANTLLDVCRFVPLDRILSETDSPYLAPVPYRGKRNEPAFVTEVTKKIAELKNLPVEKVASIIRENTLNLFKKIER